MIKYLNFKYITLALFKIFNLDSPLPNYILKKGNLIKILSFISLMISLFCTIFICDVFSHSHNTN